MMEYNYTPRPRFLSRETKKHPKMQKNNKTYQLVITDILIGMKQCIYVTNLKKFWWELDRKYDLIRNQATFF